MYGPRSAEPLRVVHVATAYQRHEDDVVTPWLSKLIAAQRDSGLDASVLAPSYKGLASGRVADVPVRRFRYAPRAWETLTHEETVPDRLRGSPAHGALVAPYLAGGLWAALRLGRQRPEVVHVHWPVPHALFGATARFASEGHTALVCTFYSVEIRWIERRAPWLRPLLAWSVRAPDAVTAISSTTAALVQRIEPREVSVIPFAATLEGTDRGGGATCDPGRTAPPSVRRSPRGAQGGGASGESACPGPPISRRRADHRR